MDCFRLKDRQKRHLLKRYIPEVSSSNLNLTTDYRWRIPLEAGLTSAMKCLQLIFTFTQPLNLVNSIDDVIKEITMKGQIR
jgi:hypothetical protein